MGLVLHQSITQESRIRRREVVHTLLSDFPSSVWGTHPTLEDFSEFGGRSKRARANVKCQSHKFKEVFSFLFFLVTFFIVGAIYRYASSAQTATWKRLLVRNELGRISNIWRMFKLERMGILDHWLVCWSLVVSLLVVDYLFRFQLKTRCSTTTTAGTIAIDSVLCLRRKLHHVHTRRTPR